MLLEHAIKCLISLLVSLCKDSSGCWHNTGMSSHPFDHTCDSAPSKHIMYWYCDLVFVHLLMSCLEHWCMPSDELSLMALQTNRSILILVCTSRISICLMQCFTMDAKLSKAVTEAFIRLHRDRLIYRLNMPLCF